MLLLFKLKIIMNNKSASLVRRYAPQSIVAFVLFGIQYTKHIKVALHSREHDTSGTEIPKRFPE